MVPFASRFSFVTPNLVSVLSFIFYFTGSVFLFLEFPYHLVLSIVFLSTSYLLDCLDGQLARFKNATTFLGDYLDKVLDVLKIFVITLSLALTNYFNSNSTLYIFLGFLACFFFNFRYYIKLETMLGQVNRDAKYLEKSRSVRRKLYIDLKKKHDILKKTLLGKIKVFIFWNRSLFFVDEGEFIFITVLFSILNRLDLALIIIAVSQVIIASFRFFERAIQINKNSYNLYLPMRK